MICQFGQIVLKVDHLRLKLTISRESRVVWDADGATISCVSSSVFDFDSKRASLLLSSHPLPRSDAAADNELKIVLCEGIIGCTKRGGPGWVVFSSHVTHVSPWAECWNNPFHTATVSCKSWQSLFRVRTFQVRKMRCCLGGGNVYALPMSRECSRFVDGASIIERLVMDRN